MHEQLDATETPTQFQKMKTKHLLNVPLNTGRKASKSDKYVVEMPLRKVLRQAGIMPFSEEKLEAHRDALIKRSGVVLPETKFQTYIVKTLSRSARIQRSIDLGALLAMILFAVGIIVPSFISIMIFIGKSFGYFNSTSYYPLMMTLGVSLIGLLTICSIILYLIRLAEFTVVEWARVHIYPDSNDVPKNARQLIDEVYFHSRDAGVKGIMYRVEFPLCEKIDDPLLFVRRGNGDTFEEYCIDAWI